LVLQSANSALEAEAIREQLASLLERGAVELADISKGTVAALQREVEAQPRVLHIAAQGDEAGIAFGAGDQPMHVPYRALAGMLRDARQLALVVLSVCDSAGTAPEGTAPLRVLVEAGIPAAVGMSGRITPSAAWRFSEGLYGGLARGDTVTQAFAASVFALQAAPLPDRLFAVTPVLLASGDIVPIPLAPQDRGLDPSIESRKAIAKLVRKLRATTPSPEWSAEMWASRTGPLLLAASDARDELRKLGQRLNTEQLVGNQAVQHLAGSVRAAIGSLDRFDAVARRAATARESPTTFVVAGRQLGVELTALAARLERTSHRSTPRSA
jgi:hypothetical protein